MRAYVFVLFLLLAGCAYADQFSVGDSFAWMIRIFGGLGLQTIDGGTYIIITALFFALGAIALCVFGISLLFLLALFRRVLGI